MRTTEATPISRAFSILLIVAAGALAVMFLSWSPARAAACTINWDGGAATTVWHDGANWDTNVVPVPADVVCIQPGAATTVTYSTGTANIAQLTTNANGSIAVTGGSLTVDGTATVGVWFG